MTPQDQDQQVSVPTQEDHRQFLTAGETNGKDSTNARSTRFGAKKARDAAAESLKKMGDKSVDALKRTPAAAAKLVSSVAKRGAQGAAKLLPAFGKGMNLYLGFEKLRTGDYVGAVGEAAGLIPFIGIGV